MPSKKSNRSHYFTFVAYPESAPEDWKEIIDNNHVSWAASPLHDRDINGDGTPKKPHWHVLIAYDSLKTPEQAQEIADSVNATIVQIAHSPRALVRYFAHMDNPDKAQYDKRDIICRGGFDLDDMLRTSNQTKYDVLKEILSFCVVNDVTEYEDLVIYAMANEPDWFEALADSCTYMVNSFIKSRRGRKQRERAEADD